VKLLLIKDFFSKDFDMKNCRYKAKKLTAFIFIGVLIVFGFLSSGKVFSNILLNKPAELTFDAIESLYNEDVFLKEALINYNGGFRNLIGQRVIKDADINNMVIKTADGSLTSIMWQYDTKPRAQSVIALNDFLAEQSIPLLYIQTPYKIIEGYTQLPTGITDFSNYDVDLCLSVLEEGSADYLDLRQEAVVDELDPATMFFRTDHHWTTKTAFWAFTKVANRMADDYGFEINKDYLNLDEYIVSSYPQSFLGSEGRRVGQLYSGLDDYDFIAPGFDTEISVKIFKENGEVRSQDGNFVEAIVFAPLLDMEADPSTNHYACYFGGDYPNVIIKNHNLDNGKVLIVKDSFALPFVAFLSNVVQEINMIDLRYFTNKSLADYISDYQPDMVMILYNPSSLSGQQMFDFGL